jgi:hypothetical protein
MKLRQAERSNHPYLRHMPILLVRDDPGRRLEVCSGIREADEACFRLGSVVPRSDWRPVDEAQHVTGWERYEAGKCLYENVALIRVTDATVLQEACPPRAEQQIGSGRKERDAAGSVLASRAPSMAFEQVVAKEQDSPDSWRVAFEHLDAICKRLCPDFPLEHKGRWLAKGVGTTLSTTWDRNDRKFTGLHVDRWERKPLGSYKSARNRVCLNMGPRHRYLVFTTIDLLAIAARYRIDLTVSVTTLHAQTYLREHPTTPVYRLRIEPGEAYVAPTECLIHDGQASSVAGEWVDTVFGRFEQTDAARSLSAV